MEACRVDKTQPGEEGEESLPDLCKGQKLRLLWRNSGEYSFTELGCVRDGKHPRVVKDEAEEVKGG